jgi:hypothetical protein
LAVVPRTLPGAPTRCGLLRSQWQRVAKLILAEEDVATVSRALELALFVDAKLFVSKVPAK